MSEVMKIQEPTLKVRETASIPDVTPCPEYPEKDTWYSLMTQLFHAPSALNSLPEAWGRMMGANRAHLVIMLREAGAGHDPFGDAEWPSTPTQVWENLAKVEQLPNLDGADLSGLDFKWADLSNTDLTGTDLRWTTLVGANLEDADLRGAIIDGTNLEEADLTGANLTGVNLRSAYLDDTKLDGAIGLEL